jgi:hypothetical protein
MKAFAKRSLAGIHSRGLTGSSLWGIYDKKPESTARQREEFFPGAGDESPPTGSYDQLLFPFFPCLLQAVSFAISLFFHPHPLLFPSVSISWAAFWGAKGC